MCFLHSVPINLFNFPLTLLTERNIISILLQWGASVLDLGGVGVASESEVGLKLLAAYCCERCGG